MKQKVEQFQKLLELLPPPNRCLLSSMIVHMTHIIAKVIVVIVNMTQVTSMVVNTTAKVTHYLTSPLPCFMMGKKNTIIHNCARVFTYRLSLMLCSHWTTSTLITRAIKYLSQWHY